MTRREEAPGKGFGTPWAIFWAALAVRVAYITVGHAYRFPIFDEHAEFGREMGRIARALANGRGYADPFDGQTGPTAWVAPLYPLLLAGVFKLFGVYSSLSGWAILSINSVFSALTALSVYELAGRCFNAGQREKRVAVWSAWIWALYPTAMQYAVRSVWETALSTWLFSVAMVLALRIGGVGEDFGEGANGLTSKSALLFGLVWGAIALSNPSLLIFLPCCAVWVLVRLYRKGQAGILRNTLLAALVCMAMIGAWSVRNWNALHRFVPMRANFGTEFYLANGPGAWGLLMDYDHPFYDANQLQLYGQMGEIEYSKMRGGLAKAEIARDPAHFIADSLRRVYFYWFGLPHPAEAPLSRRLSDYLRVLNYAFISLAGLGGAVLALRRKVPAAGLFAMAILTVPLIYYFITAHARFRHPLEPILAILGVYLFQSAEPRRMSGITGVE